MHSPKPIEETRLTAADTITGTRPAYRIPCTCGWIGGWWTDELKAVDSYERHVRREQWAATRLL